MMTTAPQSIDLRYRRSRRLAHRW